MRPRLRALVSVIVVACAACDHGEPRTDGRATARDCARLRDRLSAIRLPSVTADRDCHRAAIAASLGDAFVRTCADTMSPGHVRCGCEAKDAAALAACADGATPVSVPRG